MTLTQYRQLQKRPAVPGVGSIYVAGSNERVNDNSLSTTETEKQQKNTVTVTHIELLHVISTLKLTRDFIGFRFNLIEMFNMKYNICHILLLATVSVTAAEVLTQFCDSTQ